MRSRDRLALPPRAVRPLSPRTRPPRRCWRSCARDTRYPSRCALRDRESLSPASSPPRTTSARITPRRRCSRVADRILRLAGRPGLTVVEAGSGKGGSTAKLSLVDPPRRRPARRLRLVPRHPANTEVHRNLWGRRVEFRAGAFRGRLPSVRRTVARFGAPEVCEFRKGWFADTLPAFDGPRRRRPARRGPAQLDPHLPHAPHAAAAPRRRRLHARTATCEADRRSAGRRALLARARSASSRRASAASARRKLLAIGAAPAACSAAAPQRPPAFARRSRSRSSTRRILPLTVFGSASTNSISRGYLYGRGHALHVLLQLARPARRPARAPGCSTTNAFTISPRTGIGARHDRRLDDRRVLEQRALDLERADAVAGRDDDVVGAADEPEVAVLVAARAVAGQVPLAAPARRGLLGVLPVLEEERRRMAAQREVADLARRAARRRRRR